MFKKKLIIFAYLIIVLSKVVCLSDFMISNRNGDNLTYCVTDSEYAIAWVTLKNEPTKQISTFVPNTNIKRFSLLDPPRSNVWSLKKSLPWNINEVILDRRWENMEITEIECIDRTSQPHNNYSVMWSNLSHNFDIPFSVLPNYPILYISFCDGPSRKLVNCYVLELKNVYIGSYDFKILKCSTHDGFSYFRLRDLNCYLTLKKTSRYSISFSEYWSHFKMSKIENKLSLFNFDGEDYHTILWVAEAFNDSINVTRMRTHSEHGSCRSRSYFKFHKVENLFYADQESTNIRLTNYSINAPNGEICISFFVLMCNICQLKLTLTKDNKTFFEKEYGPKIITSWQSMWYPVKFLVENLEKGKYTVLISTIGNNQKQFWAVDEIRECQKREFRTLDSYTETECQLMNRLNNVISLNDIILEESEDRCDLASFGGICVPHYWLYSNRSSGIKFCSTYNEKRSVCSCVSGFIFESSCTKPCNKGSYGYNCKNKCHCLGISNATCHYITGMCKNCPSNYTGLECNIKIPPVRDILIYTKDNNSISVRWKPATEIVDHYYYSFSPNKYVLTYSDGKDRNTSILSSKESDYHCELWPVFLCIKLMNLKDNTEYTVEIKVEYLHHVDIRRDDISPVSIVQTRTKTEPSEAPYDLKMIWDEKNFLTLEWKHPNQSNGIISIFIIQISTSTLKEKYTRLLNVDSYNVTYYYEIRDYIPPATAYLIELSAYNGHEGKKLKKLDISPPDVPSLIREPQTTTSGDVIKITIAPKQPRGSLNTYLYQLFVYISSDCFAECREEDEFGLKKALLVMQCNLTKFNQNISFFIGNVSQRVSQPQKCYDAINNLKLNSEKTYNITIVLKNSFRNVHRIKVYSLIYFAEKSSIKNLYFILGILILFLILFVAVTIVYRRRKHNAETAKKAEHSESHPLKKIKTTATEKIKQEEKMKDTCSMPVSLKDFNSYVTQCEKSKEFERQHEMVVAKFLEDVYEEVIGEYFDYINMISIKSETVLNAYIVMALLPQTNRINFWKFVWNNNVQYIVLQKHIDEEACKQYWPEKNDKMNCDGISVQLAFTKAFQNYYYRKFILIQADEIRQVDQVHLTYTGIDPDKYVPFFKKILKFPLNSQSPILMHSSHGLDRVGLILLCDMSLKMAEQEHVIDVWKILKELANYKIKLAGNSLQYRFAHSIILKCLLEENHREIQENVYINY